MQIFVYLTITGNKTHIYTLLEMHTYVLRGWSAAFIANDKETRWEYLFPPQKEMAVVSVLRCAEKNFIMLFLSYFFPSPLSALFSFSLSHSKSTPLQYISLSDFIDLWPVMFHFASSTFIYAIPRAYTFWSKKWYSLLSACGAHFAGTISSEKAVTQYMRLWQGIM